MKGCTKICQAIDIKKNTLVVSRWFVVILYWPPLVSVFLGCGFNLITSLPKSRNKRQAILFWEPKAPTLPSAASNLIPPTSSKFEPELQLDMGQTAASLNLKPVQIVCICSNGLYWHRAQFLTDLNGCFHAFSSLVNATHNYLWCVFLGSIAI